MLYDNRADGKILEMIDGTVWKVTDPKIANTAIWLTADDIEICGDTLVNVDQDEEVEAKRIK